LKVLNETPQYGKGHLIYSLIEEDGKKKEEQI
jgi:hypothetical protein